ncbi:hypothetical protein C8Q80DRAFT_520118 [Daedaleopsis nitida]|nr:hypothetical protein C8Q80DRAFT_520118 [Daedaleopsis nitida]
MRQRMRYIYSSQYSSHNAICCSTRCAQVGQSKLHRNLRLPSMHLVIDLLAIHIAATALRLAQDRAQASGRSVTMLLQVAMTGYDNCRDVAICSFHCQGGFLGGLCLLSSVDLGLSSQSKALSPWNAPPALPRRRSFVCFRISSFVLQEKQEAPCIVGSRGNHSSGSCFCGPRAVHHRSLSSSPESMPCPLPFGAPLPPRKGI